MQWFEENVDTLYNDYEMSTLVKIMVTLGIVSFFGLITYCIAKSMFAIPEFEENINDLKQLIKLQRKKIKND